MTAGIAFALVIWAALVGGERADRWYRIHRHRLHTIDIGPTTDLLKCRACTFQCIAPNTDPTALRDSQRAHRADIRHMLEVAT